MFAHQNQFGRFESGGKIYAITDPGTPMPWVNVVSNGRFGFVVSQNGGGFSWLDNSQLNALTRWEMDLVRDAWGKHLYLADRETADVWSLAPAPCHAKYDSYRCEHSQGWSAFHTDRAGIRASWTMAVAPRDPVEVWLVTVTNTSDRPRSLRISSYFEWCCGVAPDAKREFHRLFFTLRHDPERRAIIATKNMWDVPARTEKEHWNRPWPYVVAHAMGGTHLDNPLAIGDKSTFLGRYGQAARPAAMTQPEPAVDGFGRFGDPSASLGGDFKLAPGESATITYAIVATQSEAELQTLVDRYGNASAVKGAIDQAEEFWNRLLERSQVRSAASDFDILNSTWLPYQTISGRLWARTGYYQQSGAFGFRDQLQDSQVWLAREPARTRAQILLHAAHQFADGSVYHWWHPLTETGLRTLCSDDYLWLPFLTTQYIKDTGDTAILAETAAFVDDAKVASLLEHCRRAIARALSRISPRGLPLIGACDWNDGLSALGVEGRGESVWLAQFLAFVLNDFAQLLEGEGDVASARAYREHRRKLIEAVEKHAWDGAWYRAATGDDGRWLGAKENDAGRIFLNTQTWAVLADTSPPDRVAAAWKSVKDQLLSPMGPLLSAPAYSEPDEDIGYITRYAPGLRENGGVYMHAATWALAAACKLRDSAAATRIWNSISPPLRSKDAEAYVAEPYVTPGNVDGPASATPGKAGWTWYTGSSGWLNRVSLEWILGMRPTWEGLMIDPCPIEGLGRVEATRQWRGATVRLKFDAQTFRPGEPAQLRVDGVECDGNVIRPADVKPGKIIEVEARWGERRRGTELAVEESNRSRS